MNTPTTIQEIKKRQEGERLRDALEIFVPQLVQHEREADFEDQSDGDKEHVQQNRVADRAEGGVGGQQVVEIVEQRVHPIAPEDAFLEVEVFERDDQS
ncbi:hypothetical protein OMP38_11325 [Cohnella ginsengisoli]|uniref:Uncharacterized protein n=1 Tax=Cohnella ginsengisoli TaxID=425004 RepID=A0A9X4QMJ0_9BACL|nr:hypothetical protein [Cohnella ginsengisoli]MDG0791391.1 hypothetical protein [Cohnella ginsengisoli]